MNYLVIIRAESAHQYVAQPLGQLCGHTIFVAIFFHMACNCLSTYDISWTTRQDMQQPGRPTRRRCLPRPVRVLRFDITSNLGMSF